MRAYKEKSSMMICAKGLLFKLILNFVWQVLQKIKRLVTG